MCITLRSQRVKRHLGDLIPFSSRISSEFPEYSMGVIFDGFFSVTLHCVNCEITFVLILCMSTLHRSEQLHIVETLLHILQMVSTVEQGVQGLGG